MLDKRADLLLYFDSEHVLSVHGGTSKFDVAPVTEDGIPVEEEWITETPEDREEDFEWLETQMTEEELKIIAERDQEERGEEVV